MKLLKAVFVILILITFAELSYYLYLNFYVKPQKSSITDDRTITIDNNTSSQKKPTDEEASLFGNDLMRYILAHQNIPSQKFYLTQEVEGYVGKIGFDNVVNEDQIYIVDKSGQKIVDIHISDDFKPRVKFLKEENGKETIIDMSDIKKGDRIFHRQITDIFDKTKVVTEYKIIR